MAAVLVQVLSLRRLQRVSSLRLRTVSDQLFRALLLHPGVRHLDARYTDLSYIQVFLLHPTAKD